MMAVLVKTLRELAAFDLADLEIPRKQTPRTRRTTMMTPSLQTSMNSAASLRDELISYGNEGLLPELAGGDAA